MFGVFSGQNPITMNSVPPVLTVSQPPSKTFLIVTTIVFGVVGLLAVPGSFVSLFAFDAPGSDKNPFLWGAVFCMWALPVLCPLSIIAAWVLHVRRKTKAARWVALLPVCSLVLFIVMAVGAALY